MKKLIAILLVVLVAGFVFAAADATLTLSSEVKFAVNHGFSAASIASYQGVIDDPFALNSTEQEVNLGEDDYQGISYYSFASNAIADFSVTLTFDAMNATVASGSYQIPYDFKLTKGYGSVGDASYSSSTGGIVGLIVEDSNDLGSEDIVLLDDDLATAGPTWASYKIEVKVSPTNISAYGLPVGYYKGNIVANITAQ